MASISCFQSHLPSRTHPLTLHQFTINPSNDLTLPAGSNAQVVYSLTDSAEGHFSIEATTGVIRLEKPLRVRPQAALLLTVRASDLGTPTPLSTLGTVTVSVVGLEDYLPVFLNTEHSVQVPEDTPLGTEVLQLATLTRPGAEKTGYRMVSGNEQRRFRLDARTGERASPEAAPGHMRMRGLAGLLDSSHTAFLPLEAPSGHPPLALSSLCISPSTRFLLHPGDSVCGITLISPHLHPGPWATHSPATVYGFKSQLSPSSRRLKPPTLLGCTGSSTY